MIGDLAIRYHSHRDWSLPAALRRSKKRVRAVITTELPLLVSREFSSNQENDLQMINSTAGHFDQASADAHSVRWNTLFGQMDKALSEEEGQLVRFATIFTRINIFSSILFNTLTVAILLKNLNYIFFYSCDSTYLSFCLIG